MLNIPTANTAAAAAAIADQVHHGVTSLNAIGPDVRPYDTFTATSMVFMS
jgi:hypothetical protein